MWTAEASRTQVAQCAEAARSLEDEVDHGCIQSEIGQHQDRDVGSDRLQSRGRRHGGQTGGVGQCVAQWTSLESDPGSWSRRGGGQTESGGELWIAPHLPVSLPLPLGGAQLDDRIAGTGQCPQHCFTMFPGPRNLRLRGEKGRLRLPTMDGGRLGEERQGGQADGQR